MTRKKRRTRRAVRKTRIRVKGGNVILRSLVANMTHNAANITRKAQEEIVQQSNFKAMADKILNVDSFTNEQKREGISVYREKVKEERFNTIRNAINHSSRKLKNSQSNSNDVFMSVKRSAKLAADFNVLGKKHGDLETRRAYEQILSNTKHVKQIKEKLYSPSQHDKIFNTIKTLDYNKIKYKPTKYTFTIEGTSINALSSTELERTVMREWIYNTHMIIPHMNHYRSNENKDYRNVYIIDNISDTYKLALAVAYINSRELEIIHKAHPSMGTNMTNSHNYYFSQLIFLLMMYYYYYYYYNTEWTKNSNFIKDNITLCLRHIRNSYNKNEFNEFLKNLLECIEKYGFHAMIHMIITSKQSKTNDIYERLKIIDYTTFKDFLNKDENPNFHEWFTTDYDVGQHLIAILYDIKNPASAPK